MKKVELIDVNNYFVESRKAIKIAVEKELSLHADMPKRDKLRLLKGRKKETTSPEEYEEIEKLERQLEKEIRFNNPVPLVPDEHKEKIRRNAEIEAAAVDQKLKELKAELQSQLPYLQDVILPLLINVRRLNALRRIPYRVSRVLDFTFHDGTGLRIEGHVRPLSDAKGKSKSIKALESIIRAIEAIKN